MEILEIHYVKGNGLVPCPKQVTIAPRLEDLNVGEGEFEKDAVMLIDSTIVISILLSLLEEVYIGN